ncbi:MAG: carbon monoxide dehydrogenase [Candidatus Abyssobacteria bacterium SURF_5]|uniref:Carbon monoxide dehydrogenase n=1 Tax=Abyssobacteria bacterium (strain SURF_5) TaxID=2093360 RepID=A0A3A4NWQ8_ABYX5|nr:MAG: carbon monoxide dehydrogenase [Candidatus Abyssubacteria bacterium SURF_5]
MKIAIVGKGGVGKTTLAGTLARMLADDGYKVMAIDADPDANLASAIGCKPEIAREITPIADMKDFIRERTGAQQGYGVMFKLNPKVDDIPDTYSREVEGVKFLIMGSLDGGGTGCLCPENVVLRRFLEEVLEYRDETVILDMEAGLEHLGRGTARAVDLLVIVVEPGLRSIETARSIIKLASDLGIQAMRLVMNKVVDEADAQLLRKNFPDNQILGYISYDRNLMTFDREGKAAYDAYKSTDAGFLKEMTGIKEKVIALIESGSGAE